MLIQFLAHAGRGALSDDGLQDADKVFESAVENDGCKVQTAVNQQQVESFKVDGLVDDTLLHLQGEHPGQNRGEDR